MFLLSVVYKLIKLNLKIPFTNEKYMPKHYLKS